MLTDLFLTEYANLKCEKFLTLPLAMYTLPVLAGHRCSEKEVLDQPNNTITIVFSKESREISRRTGKIFAEYLPPDHSYAHLYQGHRKHLKGGLPDGHPVHCRGLARCPAKDSGASSFRPMAVWSGKFRYFCRSRLDFCVSEAAAFPFCPLPRGELRAIIAQIIKESFLLRKEVE